jgi:hypothetical protein
VLLEHFVLILPLVRNEHRHQSLLPRDRQFGTTRRLEITMIQSDLISAYTMVESVHLTRLRYYDAADRSLTFLLFNVDSLPEPP